MSEHHPSWGGLQACIPQPGTQKTRSPHNTAGYKHRGLYPSTSSPAQSPSRCAFHPKSPTSSTGKGGGPRLHSSLVAATD